MSFFKEFNRLQKIVYEINKDHGFHEKDKNELYVPTALALIASEVSEALEVDRKDIGEFEMGLELADIVIRTMDLAESQHIDLAKYILYKMTKNKIRPYKHGNKKY